MGCTFSGICVYLGCCMLGIQSVQAALVSLQRTPYDRQLERIQHVLSREASQNNGNPGDIDTINQAMRAAYRLPYTSYAEWQSPEETYRNKRADCKARAVLLHHKLNEAGVGSHRLVIGRLKGGNSDSHTWLVWKTKEAEYLLDPTYYRKPIRMDKVSEGKYIPEFIYCGGKKYGYVPNHIVFDGLDGIPQHIRERSKKTRVYLADEDKNEAPTQANKPNTNFPGSDLSDVRPVQDGNEEKDGKSLQEARNKVPERSKPDPKVSEEAPSIASVN